MTLALTFLSACFAWLGYELVTAPDEMASVVYVVTDHTGTPVGWADEPKELRCVKWNATIQGKRGVRAWRVTVRGRSVEVVEMGA